jgi:flagellar basal body rod protein FlgG
MGIGDIGFSAIKSLITIDTWIGTINSNMGGAGRVGFKQTRTKFEGIGVVANNAAHSPQQATQVGEQTLGIVQTSLDFSAGTVVASEEITHFAISKVRDNFFLVDRRVNAATTITGVASDYNTLLATRDGEFHWGPLEGGVHYLLDTYGNYVVNGNTANNFKNGAATVELISATDAQMADPNFLLSSGNATPGLVQVTTPQFLQFSEFGATHFELPRDPNNVVGTTINTPIDGRASGVLQQYALEGSNASLTLAVPELSLAQKLYSAISKVMSVFNSTIDDTLQLIR